MEVLDDIDSDQNLLVVAPPPAVLRLKQNKVHLW